LYDKDDPQYNMLEKRLELIQIKKQEAVDAYEDGMDIIPLLMQLVEQTPEDAPRGEAQEISMKRRKIEQTIKNLKKVKESGLKQDPSAIKFDQEFGVD